MTNDRSHAPSPIPRAVRSGLTGAAILCLATSPATAQESPTSGGASGFGERVEVTLVNVDVWVSDAEGAPVSGLEPQQFEVLHDGQPVEISNFVEVRGGAIVDGGTAAAENPETARVSNHMIVYFDQTRLHPTHAASLSRGLEQLLEADSVAPENVLILRQDRRLSVEAPFGSSRKELRAALDRLAQGDAAGLDLETEGQLALAAVRSAWEQAEDSVAAGASGLSMIPSLTNPGDEAGSGGGSPRAQVGGFGSGGGPDACGSFVNQVQPILDSWVRSRSQRVAVTLDNLSDAAGFLAGLPGVKTLIYLSDGLDTTPGIDLATYASDLCPSAGADLLSGPIADGMSDRFLELTRRANTNRVTLYALQATGLRAPGAANAAADGGSRRGRSLRSSGSFEARQRASERDGLALIATRTGGRAVFDRNEFGPELVRIADEARSYYSLAYPLPEGGADTEHRIEVRLTDDSLDARYRRDYRREGNDEWLTERIEGALNLGITDNPLAVRLGAGAARAGGEGKSLLPVHVMVPVEKLAFLPHGETHAAQVAIKIMARSLASDELSISSQMFNVKGAPGATGWADLPVTVELGPGAYLTAIGVQDRGSGEASFVSTTLSGGGQ